MNHLQEEFDHYLAGIAWNAWRELGVAGTERFYENCLIQPEELIILTVIIADYDPRLRDEALDWSSRYHEYISVSRLRTLLKGMDANTNLSFSQFAATLNSFSSAKWPGGDAVALFTPKVTGKSLLPTPDSPSLLMLRLRNLFGPGARADVLTHFLTRNGIYASASDLNTVGYSKRSLLTALDHLALSGVLDVTHVGNKKNYKLGKPKEFQVIIGKLPKIAPPWIQMLQAIIAIRTVIPEIQNSSASTRGVILRNCLIKIEPLLPIFISPILQNNTNFERDWKAVTEIFKAFQQGNFFMQFEVYNDFDTIVNQLLRDLYQVLDCVDGIEFIQERREFEISRHEEIFKECYQLFLSFISDLKASLKHFLNSPFHKMMDESLSDISYRFSKEKFPRLLEMMDRIQPIDRITHAQAACRQYQLFSAEFDVLRQFIYTVTKRLEDLYHVRTCVPVRPTFYKRHLVIALFLNVKE